MKIAIIGSALTGGAIQIIDILLNDRLTSNIRIYDDDVKAIGTKVLGVPVVGPISHLNEDFREGLIDNAIIAVGTILPRERLYKEVQKISIPLPTIIASSALVSQFAHIGEGNVILPLCYVGPNTIIGDNNYITTSTIINHDSKVGSHCYFSTSVNIAGRATIGNRVRIDTGASITADAIVQDDELIGPGVSYGPARGR